jgi:hypothetical protein
MYDFKEPQRYHARLIDLGSGQPVVEAGMGDNSAEALDGLLFWVRQSPRPLPEYR